jgi:DNA processing protein
MFAIGNITVDGPAVAIVGTRKPTVYGKAVTLELAEKLAKRGAIIVSGLALGIDCIAQEAAANIGGRTIAVLASGLDEITPRSNRNIAIKILEKNGGLLSENPPGTPARQWEFLKRNRLVSALADTVVVTEASVKSGTMNTVMHALEQGKDVFAVPGNITSPTSAGCNKLIEQGATPIVNIDEFVEQIVPSENTPKQQLLLSQSPEEQVIIELIQSGISDGDELAVRSKLPPDVFSTTMTMLEIRSVIRPLGANQWRL